MTRVSQLLRRFVTLEEAATMVEYAIMIALIAIVCFAAVQILGGNTNTLFGLAVNSFP
jgi:pilus assembly protein Flp/PilA